MPSNVRSMKATTLSRRLALLSFGAAIVLAMPHAAHAQAAEQATNPENAACLGCHGSPGLEMPTTSGQPRAWLVPEDLFAASVHGQVLRCTDCHTAIGEFPHKISKSNSEWREQALAVTGNCSNCHEQAAKGYRDTHHGKLAVLGFTDTALCSDCHGTHGIQRASVATSKVSKANVLNTCRECHSDATAGFASFLPHATTDDFNRYPTTWLTSKLMIVMLVSALGIFWVHSVLWFYREYRDRREGKPRPHVRTDVVPLAKGEYVQRWSLMWRIAHFSFALTVIGLVVTGIPLLYPDTTWAPLLQRALGGPQMVSLLHKLNAVVMVAIFAVHLLYVAVHLAFNWKSFKIFGPDSLMPNWQDARDVLAMCKWFAGKGPRPACDHWNYMQKVDYWAPFWGIAMLTVTGAMLWFTSFTAAYLPGWVFNIATIAHGEEALLAAAYLFTIHYFSTHWRPDKFPLDVVMFTGTMPLEEFKREYTLEYDRLLENGELPSYLVQAPSRPMTLGSKVLGFTLVGIGLALFVLLVDGVISKL